MKIYLVEVDNGESYEDYRSWIDSVFTTYRGATQYLLDEGFELCWNSRYNELDIYFFKQYDEDDYMLDCEFARIIEKELINE